MAIDVFAHNTTTLASGAAFQLGANIDTPGIYCLTVNMANMASGDVLTVTIKGQSQSGGSFVLQFSQTFTGAQSVPLQKFPGIEIDYAAQVFIQQTGGTLREYDWVVTRIDA